MANILEKDALEIQYEQRSIKKSLTNKGCDMNDTPFNDYHNKIDELGNSGDGTGVGTNNYNDLINKPSINGEVLSGDKTLEDFGFVPYDDTILKNELANKQPKGDYAKKSDIPTFTSQLINDSDFINNDALVNYYPKDETYSKEELNSKGFLTSEQLAKVAISGDFNDLSNPPNIPKTTDDLENTSGFITNTVTNLTNYYDVNSSYSRKEIDKIVSDLTGGGVIIMLVSSIDLMTNPNIIYLLPSTDDPEEYDEYLLINNTPQCIGTTKDFYSKKEIDNKGFVTNEILDTSMSKRGNSYVKRLINQTITSWVKEGSISEKYPYVGTITINSVTESDWKVVDYHTFSPMFEFLYHEVDVLDGKIQFYASRDCGELVFDTIDVSSVLLDLNVYVDNKEALEFLNQNFISIGNGYTRNDISNILLDYVLKDGDKTLSTNDFTNEYKNRLLNDLCTITEVREIIPKNISEFNNDVNYITKEVSELSNFYNKTDITLQIKKELTDVIQKDSLVTTQMLANYYDIPTIDKMIPVNITDLHNDTEFINNKVNNLRYYYNKDEIDAKFSNVPIIDDVSSNTESIKNLINNFNVLIKELKDKKVITGEGLTPIIVS